MLFCLFHHPVSKYCSIEEGEKGKKKCWSKTAYGMLGAWDVLLSFWRTPPGSDCWSSPLAVRPRSPWRTPLGLPLLHALCTSTSWSPRAAMQLFARLSPSAPGATWGRGHVLTASVQAPRLGPGPGGAEWSDHSIPFRRSFSTEQKDPASELLRTMGWLASGSGFVFIMGWFGSVPFCLHLRPRSARDVLVLWQREESSDRPHAGSGASLDVAHVTSCTFCWSNKSQGSRDQRVRVGPLKEGRRGLGRAVASFGFTGKRPRFCLYLSFFAPPRRMGVIPLDAHVSPRLTVPSPALFWVHLENISRIAVRS